MCEEADPGPERDPRQDKVEGVLNSVEEKKGNKVYKPWRELGGIGSVERFIRSKDGQEDRNSDAGDLLAGVELSLEDIDSSMRFAARLWLHCMYSYFSWWGWGTLTSSRRR